MRYLMLSELLRLRLPRGPGARISIVIGIVAAAIGGAIGSPVDAHAPPSRGVDANPTPRRADVDASQVDAPRSPSGGVPGGGGERMDVFLLLLSFCPLKELRVDWRGFGLTLFLLLRRDLFPLHPLQELIVNGRWRFDFGRGRLFKLLLRRHSSCHGGDVHRPLGRRRDGSGRSFGLRGRLSLLLFLTGGQLRFSLLQLLPAALELLLASCRLGFCRMPVLLLLSASCQLLFAFLQLLPATLGPLLASRRRRHRGYASGRRRCRRFCRGLPFFVSSRRGCHSAA
mmetsp:Transcript_48476/g.103111  ORF Transcript_48476/g.103111 Transcript_48476/m.103111 type:complete len:284 (-) Transcript_48476:338-1189(-)